VCVPAAKDLHAETLSLSRGTVSSPASPAIFSWRWASATALLGLKQLRCLQRQKQTAWMVHSCSYSSIDGPSMSFRIPANTPSTVAAR
jgi:hypothetical protein